MKNTTKRTIAAMSAAAMLMSGGIIGALAEEDGIMLISAPEESVEASTVTPAVSYGYLVGSMTVGESDEDGAIASEDKLTYIYKSEATAVLGSDGSVKSWDDIEAGAKLSYYVDGNAPMTMQYPPHYTADVVVIEDEENSVFRKIGVFGGEELVNEENNLQLNIDEETTYITKGDEDTFKGGKALVFYGITTRSIPAQTAPITIVALADDIAEEAEELPEEIEAADLSEVKEISAGSETLAHIPVTVNGVQMLPVRAYAEALGFEVEWIEESKSVNVGHASFKIDEDAYTMGKAMPRSLGQAPVLVALPGEANATTYVPVSFFTEIFEAKIAVDGDKATIALPVVEENSEN